MKRMMRWVFVFLLAAPSFSLGESELRATGAPKFGERVDEKHPGLLVNELGVGEVHVVSNGYVFVDLKYMSPPYRVQRIGQAITINNVVINVPFNELPTTNEMARAKTDWRSSWHGWTIETPKKLADLILSDVVLALEKNGTIAVSMKTHAKTRIGGPPLGRLPRVPFLREDEILKIAMSANSMPKKIEDAKNEGHGKMSDEDWETFLKNCAESADLRERLKDKLPKE